MAHKKRRAMQQIMEEKSLVLVRSQLPEEWVIHEYAPDYGIDFVVETFDYIDDKHELAETLGEFFFVQLKSVQQAEKISITVTGRYNVEKTLAKVPDESAVIDVIKYPIDVNELHTIMSMGCSVPTILFLADLSEDKVYFICLNDYIEKILLPQREKLNNSTSVTLYIPLSNVITTPQAKCHLTFLARRSKLFGAFNKFNYQRNELKYNSSPKLILHFISIIKEYDFWNTKVVWPALTGMYDTLLEIESFFTTNDLEERMKILDELGFTKERLDPFTADSSSDSLMKTMIEIYTTFFALPYWDKLCNLGNLYEEICKEWFLPTYLWSTYNQ
ncbi:MAG: DUF4365 domain-containing protein [Oscillospiraceae bacterium]|nr:DUF4365 domain-containing protein [Oscillospiraceae bacterium]